MFTICRMKSPRNILKEALSAKIAVNPQYSLRAFARDLQVSPQQLSNFMNGRRGMSMKAATQISERLDLTPKVREWFRESVRAEHSRSASHRDVALEALAGLRKAGKTTRLEYDAFKTIANWYHFTLIELIKLGRKPRKTVDWLSRKLGLPENEIRTSLSRLTRLGLVGKTTDGWKANQKALIADELVSMPAVHSFHRQIIGRSLQALEFQTFEERYGSSSVIPVKASDLPKAMALIREFRTHFAEQMSATQEGDEIYALSIQYFRLTEKTEGK